MEASSSSMIAAGLLAAALIVLLAFSFWSGDSRTGTAVTENTPRTERPITPPANKPRPIYVGVSACAQCHNLPKPLEDKNFPPLCRCTEVSIWQNEDRHKLAYIVLEGARGQQMGKLLHRDVTKDAACLSCHSINPRKDVDQDPSFHLSEGVSCVLCHGAYENWIDEHGSAIYRKRERELEP